MTPGHPSSGHQARSSDSIKKKSLQSCHSHSGGEEDLKIAGFGIPSGTYILYISEFLYDWPEVRFAGKSMEKTQIHYTLIRSVQIIQNRGHLG